MYRLDRYGQSSYIPDDDSVNARWSGLMGGYKLNEQSDGSTDVERADVLGTYPLTSVNTVASETGLFDYSALIVRANNEYLVSTPGKDYYTFQSGTSLRTIAFFVRPETLVNYETLVDNAGSNGAFVMYTGVGGAIVFQVTYSGGSLQVNSGTPNLLSAGSWNTVVCWYDDADQKIRVSINDGTPSVSASGHALADGPATGVNGFGVGTRVSQPTAYVLDGRIEDLYLFNEVKDADWRTAFHNGGAGRRYPN